MGLKIYFLVWSDHSIRSFSVYTGENYVVIANSYQDAKKQLYHKFYPKGENEGNMSIFSPSFKIIHDKLTGETRYKLKNKTHWRIERIDLEKVDNLERAIARYTTPIIHENKQLKKQLQKHAFTQVCSHIFPPEVIDDIFDTIP